MPTKLKIEIRPFREEDIAPMLAVTNRGVPEHRYYPEVAWRNSEAHRSNDVAMLRLSIGDPAVAFMTITDLATTTPKREAECEFGITVAHEHRRRGLGNALHEKALEFAAKRGAKRLIAGVTAWSSDEPGIAFLENRGFVELEREQDAYLDVARFDPMPFRAALERVKQNGVCLVTFADVGDTDENRRRLHALFTALSREVPTRDGSPFVPRTFENWWQRFFQRHEYAPDLIRLATVGGAWIGMTFLIPKEGECTGALQGLTGVLPAYQNQGVATALKVDVSIAAKEHGLTDIITDNHEDNAPMLAINQKLGFLPDAVEITYTKVLEQPAKGEHPC